MSASRFYPGVYPRGGTHLSVSALERAALSRFLALGMVLLSGNAWAANTSYIGGAGLNYKFDDNVGVALDNPLALAGWVLDGFFIGKYATSRFHASADVKLGFARYNHASRDSDNPDFAEPDASDYNYDNQKLSALVGYGWERHKLSLYAGYYRNSILNTAFLDTGPTGEQDSPGSRIQYSLSPSWQWQITERQTLATSFSGNTTYYEGGGGGIDYDSASLSFNWSYMLDERISLQVQPVYSWYKNEADISVKSNTFSLQGGVIWSITEKWRLNLLAGNTRVYTVYGQGGIVVVDPGSGVVEFVEDQDSNSFSGNTTLSFSEERYGFNANISSAVVPSGNGVLQQQNRGQVLFYWTPVERMRFDLDGLVGRSDSSDERIDNGRIYQELGLRLGYQFLQDWWLSARYRLREQRGDSDAGGETGTARSNSVYLTVSYRLPKEIF